MFARIESLGYGYLHVTDGKLVMGRGRQWNPDVNPYQNRPHPGSRHSWSRGSRAT